MFYQCPKCQKVWQYPVGICLECFLELERIKSEKIKIIGISKVTIPTMFHPKVPYFVLLLEDEKGNKWVQKSTKEYKIGDHFHVTRKDLVTSAGVVIWRLKYDVLEGIERVVELLGGVNVNQGSKVLILPTLIAPRHPYFAENTSPQFLESLIKYLIGQGVGLENIKVVGQSFDETPIEASAQKSQLLKVCQNYKIIPLDLAKTNFVKKTQDNFIFEISEEVFNSDLIINLPILKMGKISASENILKFLKKENCLGLKYLYSEEEIIESLNKVLPQYLTIAEARSVQKPDQFIAQLGLIFGSFNSLNLDRVFAEVCLLKNLPECLKKVKIEDIPIVGRKIEELQFEAEKY
ncbi:MAG: DUF362 domain-containing protein [Patescibacteria group bacterium]|nr:DUF362 domain-containing protein [Patescibacteria group bacterium]